MELLERIQQQGGMDSGISPPDIDPVWDSPLIQLRDTLVPMVRSRTPVNLAVHDANRCELRRFLTCVATEANVRGGLAIVHKSDFDPLMRDRYCKDTLLAVLSDDSMVVPEVELRRMHGSRVVFVANNPTMTSSSYQWPCISTRPSSWLGLFEQGAYHRHTFGENAVVTNDAVRELNRVAWMTPKGTYSVWSMGVFVGACASIMREARIGKAYLYFARFLEHIRDMAQNEGKPAPPILVDALEQFVHLASWTTGMDMHPIALRAWKLSQLRSYPISGDVISIVSRGSLASQEATLLNS